MLSDGPRAVRKIWTHVFANEHLGGYPGLSCVPSKLYYILVVISCDFLQSIKPETIAQNVDERPTRRSRME
jgi:hypothetical protein